MKLGLFLVLFCCCVVTCSSKSKNTRGNSSNRKSSSSSSRLTSDSGKQCSNSKLDSIKHSMKKSKKVSSIRFMAMVRLLRYIAVSIEQDELAIAEEEEEENEQEEDEVEENEQKEDEVEEEEGSTHQASVGESQRRYEELERRMNEVQAKVDEKYLGAGNSFLADGLNSSHRTGDCDSVATKLEEKENVAVLRYRWSRWRELRISKSLKRVEKTVNATRARSRRVESLVANLDEEVKAGFESILSKSDGAAAAALQSLSSKLQVELPQLRRLFEEALLTVGGNLTGRLGERFDELEMTLHGYKHKVDRSLLGVAESFQMELSDVEARIGAIEFDMKRVLAMLRVATSKCGRHE